MGISQDLISSKTARSTKMRVAAIVVLCFVAFSNANTFDELVKEELKAAFEKQEVGAYWCNGPYSTLCKNSDTCCESKDEAGKFTCCPSTHTCGSNGACVAKVAENVGAYWCNGPYSTLCMNPEACCESKDEAGKFTCCPRDTHECSANGACVAKVTQNVGAYMCAGPHSKICKNTEECCESKDQAGEFTCCPRSTHECGAEGVCVEKVTKNLGAYLCAGPYSKICKNTEECCESKDQAGEFTCCPRSTHECGAEGVCVEKVTETVGAYWCNGPYSTLCKNSDKCCESKDEAGKFTCCPSTHTCGTNGACEPKAKETVAAYWCNGPYSTLCMNQEACCESKDEAGKFTCCPKETHQCSANGACVAKVTENVGAYMCAGPHSKICKNTELCCESKNQAGEFTCCPRSTHECGSEGVCVEKATVRSPGHYKCNILQINSIECAANERCCQSPTHPDTYTCCGPNSYCSAGQCVVL